MLVKLGDKGVKIDGEFLSNLRFADDIFLCTETPQELQQMLQELSDESRRMGLKMNIAKTKVMVVDNTTINVNNVLIENVPGYVYLGQHYSLKEKNQDKEIQRRIMAGWAAYAKHRDIFKSNLAICLKRQVYNSCVLPSMTYGAETWTLTKLAQNKLAAAQTKMERSMLNITYKDRRTNIWVRESRGRPWRYSVIPSTPDFPTEYQIRRHSNPAGLPTFAAIWGPDFRASIIRLTCPHVFKQIKNIITLMTMFKVNRRLPN